MRFDEKLSLWADSHKTDYDVAEAIFWIAESERQAEEIWQDPELLSPEQRLAIWERVTRNGLVDGDDYCWGIDTLSRALEL